MLRVVKGKYYDVICMKGDVYGFKEAYSIRPIKLTHLITSAKCEGKKELDSRDVGISICVGVADLLAGFITLGIMGSRKETTYQLVVNGESLVIETNDRAAKHTLDTICRKFK